MRIERVELDGFGRFAGDRWTLGPGLNVLLGPNEAGKTTLLNAIRAILFGFEPTREGRTWYPALAGGRRGGRLTLLTDAGERWLVERHGERGGSGALAVIAPNGNRGGQETLDRLLGGASRDLYVNVFAFGLSELQSFETLTSDGVRGRIYGAGAGLGGGALELERRLREAQDAAFRPAGRQQRVNALLARMEEVAARIAELERQPAEHEEAVRALADLASERERIRAERRELEGRRAHARRLLESQPLATELGSHEARLAAGDPGVDQVGPEVLEVWERRSAALTRAREARAASDEAIAGARRMLAALEVDDAVVEAAAEIEALRDERLIQAARPEERARLEAAERQAAHELADLGRRAGGWPPERLLALDDSIEAEEATRAAERRLAEARAAHAEAARRSAELAREIADAEASSEQGPPLDEAELMDRSAALRELVGLRPRIEALTARAGSRGTGAGIGGVLAAIGGAAIGMLLGLAVASLAVPGAPVVAALLAVAAGIAGGWLGRGLATGLYPSAAGASAAEVQALERRAGELARVAGLPPDASTGEVTAAVEDLALRRGRAQELRGRQARLEERRAAVERAGRDERETRAGLERVEAGWRGWLAARRLPASASPESARALLGLVAQARRVAAALDDSKRRRRAVDEAFAAYEGRLDALLARLGRRVDPSARAAAVVELAAALDRSTADERRRPELEAELLRLEERGAADAARIESEERALAAWLASVGAADEESLRRRSAEAEARRELRRRIEALRSRLAGIAGGDERLPQLLAEAADRAPAEVEAGLAELTRRLEELDARERQAMNEEGALAALVRGLEASEELGAARQELAGLVAEASAEARAWAVRGIALRLLEETRRRYERERQPQVLRDAERLFATITDGRYVRILAQADGDSVLVEPAEGAPKRLDELSRGTAEQLYLALRFGLVEQFARVAEPLPLVMDDILVNFDASRGAAAARTIRLVAERHQVIYFTCHEPTARLLDPGAERTVALG